MPPLGLLAGELIIIIIIIIDFLLMDAFGNTPSEYSLGPPRVVATFGVDSLDGFEPGPGSSHGVSPA